MYEIDMLEIWWKKEERFTAISTDIKDICKNHLIFVKVMKVTWNTNDSSVLNTDDRKIIDILRVTLWMKFFLRHHVFLYKYWTVRRSDNESWYTNPNTMYTA